MVSSGMVGWWDDVFFWSRGVVWWWSGGIVEWWGSGVVRWLCSGELG